MKSKKGVTMLVLIITIIVILILAGISINMITNSGVLNKTNDINQMNSNAINTAKDDENRALLQDTTDFRIEDDFSINGIEIYEFVPLKESNGKTVGELNEIQVGLSQYINTHTSGMLYFKVKTNRTGVYIFSNKSLKYYQESSNIAGEEISNLTDDDVVGVILSDKKVNGQDVKNGETILAGVSIDDLKSSNTNLEYISVYANRKVKDGEIIDGEKADYKLSFVYDSNKKNTDDNPEIYINANPEKLADLWESNNYYKNEDATISEKTNITGEFTVEENGENVQKNYGSIRKKGKQELTIMGNNKSNLSSGDEAKLYSVQEVKLNDNDAINGKTFYLDNYNLKYYFPIENVKVWDYKIPKAQFDNLTQAQFNNSTQEGIKGTFELDKNYTVDGDKALISKTEFELNKESSIDENLNSEQNGGTITVKITDRFNSEITGTGNIIVTNTVAINPTIDDAKPGNFIVRAKDFETTAYDTLEEAYNTVKNNKLEIKTYENGVEAPLITQQISSYDVSDDWNIDLSGNTNKTLTYNLNGCDLIFAEDKKITVANGTTFTLQSETGIGVANEVVYEVGKDAPGTIKFSHDKSELGELKFPLFNWIRGEYQKYASFENWLSNNGITIKWYEWVYKGPYYFEKYLNDRFKAFKQWWDTTSGNNAVGHVNWSNETFGINNKGTINFESGRIEVISEETAAAYGAFDGAEAVGTIIDITLQFFEKLGMDVTSFTDLTGTYVRLKNTASGIYNDGGTVILGKNQKEDLSDGKTESYCAHLILEGLDFDWTTEVNLTNKPPQINGETIKSGQIPHPEICIYVHSKGGSYGISPGSFNRPNVVRSNAYGIWNKNGTTNMYSGFIESSGYNNIGNWWSAINVVKNYGIYNDGGTAEISGITHRTKSIKYSIWGFIKSETLKSFDEIFNTNLSYPWEYDRYGFFTSSQLQVVLKLTGAVYYSNSYALANANGGTGTISSEITKNSYSINGNGGQIVRNIVNDGFGFEFKFDTLNGTAYSFLANKLNSWINTDWIGEDNTNIDGYVGTTLNYIVDGINALKDIINNRNGNW